MNKKTKTQDPLHDLLEARKTLAKAAVDATETAATLALLEPTYQAAKSKYQQAAETLKHSKDRSHLLGNQYLWSLLCGSRMAHDAWSHIWSFYEFNHGSGIKYGQRMYDEEDRMKHYTTEVRLRSLCKAFHCSIPAPSTIFVGVPGPWNYERIDQAVDVVKWFREKSGNEEMCQIRIGPGEFEIRNLIEDKEESFTALYSSLGEQMEEALAERCTLLDYSNLRIVGSGAKKTMVYGGFHARGPLAKNILLEHMTITNPFGRDGKGINISMGASGIVVNLCEIVGCNAGVRVHAFDEDENITSKHNPENALEMNDCHIHHNRSQGLDVMSCHKSKYIYIKLVNCEIAYNFDGIKMHFYASFETEDLIEILTTIDLYTSKIHSNLLDIHGIINGSSSFFSNHGTCTATMAVRVFSPTNYQTFYENKNSYTDRSNYSDSTSSVVVQQMVLPVASQVTTKQAQKMEKRKLCREKRFAIVPDDFSTVDEAVKEARMSEGQIVEIRIGPGTHFIGAYQLLNNPAGHHSKCSELFIHFSNLQLIGAGVGGTVLVGQMVIRNAVGISIKNLSMTTWFGGYLLLRRKIQQWKWADGQYEGDEQHIFELPPDKDQSRGTWLNLRASKDEGAALTVQSSSVATDNIAVLASGSASSRTSYAVLIDDDLRDENTVLTMIRSHIHHCLNQGVLVLGKRAEASLIDCEVDHVIDETHSGSNSTEASGIQAEWGGQVNLYNTHVHDIEGSAVRVKNCTREISEDEENVDDVPASIKVHVSKGSNYNEDEMNRLFAKNVFTFTEHKMEWHEEHLWFELLGSDN